MEIRTIKDVLNASVLGGEERLGESVEHIYASDLMSDVLAFGKPYSMLLTGLATQQAVISAHMAEFKGVVFIRGKKPKDGSERFAREYMARASCREVLKRIHRKGARLAGITRGQKGSIVFDGRKFYNEEAYRVRVADTTGAGDVYHGAFVEGVLCAWPLEKTMRFASVVAGLKCKTLGGRKGIPSFSQALAIASKRRF